MTTYNICKWLLLSAFASFVSAGCSDMNEYKKFQEGGEVEYTGRILSMKVLAGDGRVAVTGILGSDPKVVKCRIYWNLRADWVDVAVDKSQTDLLYQIIELPENSYSFEILTYDAEGNFSIPTTTTGSSYGNSYKKSLANRLINSAKETDAGEGAINTLIEWRAIDTSRGAYASEVTYTDNEGAQQTIPAPVGELTTTLPNHKSGTEISHITLYKPEMDCLDVFRSSTTSTPVELLPEPEPEPEPELKELSKTLFANKKLPTDATPAAGVLGVEKLWDGEIREHWTQRLVTAQSAAPAQWVTFDTGQISKLTELKTWNYGDDSTPGIPRRHFAGFHMRHFEIWGSLEPAADGSWESWIKLGTFEVTKPSGSPVGTETEEDHAAGVAGLDFTFTDDQPKVRYIRIKNLGNWDGTTYGIDLLEVKLTGYVYPAQ